MREQLRYVLNSKCDIPIWQRRAMNLDTTNHKYKINTYDMLIVLDVFGDVATVLTKYGVGYMIKVWLLIYCE